MKQQTWEEAVAQAYRRTAGIVDLDQTPAVEYKAMYCSAAQSVIDDLVKAHEAELQRQREEIVEEIKKLKRIDKSVGDYEWTKNIGYNDAIDDIIKKVGKHD